MSMTKIKSIFVAGAVAISALAASGTAANADMRGGFYLDGPGIGVEFGNRNFRDNRRGFDDGYWDEGYRNRGHRKQYRHKKCSPRKAVRKASRKGIRHAHVVRVGHRGVIIAGRKWGERVVIGFGKHYSCPVRFVRAR